MNGLINIFRTKKARLFWLCALLCLFCCSIPSFTMAKEEDGELPSCSSLETAGSKPCVCESRWLGSDLVCQTGELCVKESTFNTGKDASFFTRMICKKINTKNQEKSAVSYEGIGSQQLYENVQAKDGDKYETKINYNETQQASNVDPSCESIDTIRAKYQGGCWSCLVIEKLTSAFLTAASKAYGLAQRAGLIALMLGAVLWVLVWGLKNVSSVSQINAPNILDELLKMAFKIALAYLFIISGLPIVRNYFINPIMGTGAAIAQQFWVGDLEERMQDYVWEDEIVSFEQLKTIENNIAKNNAQSLAESGEPSQATDLSTPEPAEETPLKAAEPVQYNSTEEIIQDLQNAFLGILRSQLNNVTNSCGGSCGKSCRHSSCKNSGHMRAVKQIHNDARSGGGGNTAYCQASVTAALNNLDNLLGGKKLTTYMNGIAGCGAAMARASSYKQGFSVSSKSGGDVQFCKNGKLNVTINAADTIYIRVGTGTTSSGYHAVTSTGGAGIISFNGDGQYANLCSYMKNARGKVVCTSCILRQILEKNPSLVNSINKTKLKELATAYGNQTFINYSGGIYSDAGSVGDGNAASLIVTIPDVTYTGPTDILSKSVMNNILTATKVITDNTAETMVLGDSIMCCAKTENCGAWKLNLLITDVTLTNIWMWLEGAIIFCIGVMLTLAVAYYLVDISFKISFAVIALPIVVGLWPFKLTSGKFTNCLSIILKSAAIYAFLAITTFFAMQMIAACFDIENANEEAAGAYQGIFEIIQSALDGEDQSDLISEKLALFSTNFILLCFCLVYAFKIIQASTNEFTDKFFSDAVFGGEVPIHHNLTAATKAAKDLAMKPIGFGRDVITHQSGRLLTHVYNRIRHSSFGGSVEATGKGVKQSGKVMKKAGQGIDKAGAALNKTKYGAIIGVPLQAAGKTTQAVGAVTEKAGQATEKAGRAIRKTQQKMKTSARILKRRLLKQNNSSES